MRVAPDRRLARGIASRLRQLLREHQQTQTELANSTGIGQSTLSAYVDGRKIPGGARIIAMALHFGVSTDWILGLSSVRHRADAAPADAVAILDEHVFFQIRQAIAGGDQFQGVSPPVVRRVGTGTRYRVIDAAELKRILSDERIRRAMPAEDPPGLA